MSRIGLYAKATELDGPGGEDWLKEKVLRAAERWADIVGVTKLFHPLVVRKFMDTGANVARFLGVISA